jgi:hypothetical protein
MKVLTQAEMEADIAQLKKAKDAARKEALERAQRTYQAARNFMRELLPLEINKTLRDFALDEEKGIVLNGARYAFLVLSLTDTPLTDMLDALTELAKVKASVADPITVQFEIEDALRDLAIQDGPDPKFYFAVTPDPSSAMIQKGYLEYRVVLRYTPIVIDVVRDISKTYIYVPYPEFNRHNKVESFFHTLRDRIDMLFKKKEK